MGEAFRLAREEMAGENARIGEELRDRLSGRPLSDIEEVYLNGDLDRRVPHNLNVSFNFVEGESLIMAIKGAGGVVRLGLHLGLLEPSYVLRAGPQRRTGAQLDPLHHRPLHHRSRSGLRHPSACCQDWQAARTVALWDMFKEGVDLNTVQWAAH